MPRLYPPSPHFPDDGGAEHAVWRALADQLPDDAVLFWGLRLVLDAHEHEIDGLVLWPGFGVAAVEVKGGHVTRSGGAWWQGSGETRHRIDPVGQVQGARHALQTLLARRGAPGSGARFAHLVALPHVFAPAAWDAVDLPRGLLVDRADLETGLGVAHRVRTALTAHGSGWGDLDAAAVDAIVATLECELPSQVESLLAAARHESRVDQLTRDQARLVDVLRNFPRFRVVGGAGSGKTWVALEQARRRARAGERVALLCYSRGLGRYLERVTATWPARDRPAYVGLFHDLPVRWGAAPGADDDPDHWETTLPRELGRLAAEQPHAELFDTVVVDEAQDFGDLWWPSLLRCLRDPDHGGLFVFMDEGQRVFPRDGVVPIDLPPFVLDENLRSTKQIAQTFGALADERLRPRGLDGPPVRVLDVPAQDAVGAADDVVEVLLDEGWGAGRVALLTTGSRHPAQVTDVAAVGHAAYWDRFFAEEDVFYGHVLGFKGLERPAVVLAVNGFRDTALARRMLYTGMSRARSLLVVVGPRALVEEVGGEAVRRRLARADVLPDAL
ncbi:nuclease-related domain-containing DEAD/DEAH box helicase [Luteimicrobium subarcticum]|uniref:UvrD-like helicase family protein n=1 Tax=Luteimicrobium subarcticum TaxID=620910 RepID=A0A2M8WW41_9MICO|nr:ATP-binding domain-containing protein [Luteimicrobium subarcticum]PJI95142.1 UvrD-like helicase family protein [Luteimicrobium subarcticum]